MIYDLKGSLGTLSEEGYQGAKGGSGEIPTWDGKVETFVEHQPKSSYQRAVDDYHSQLKYDSLKGLRKDIRSPVDIKKELIISLQEERKKILSGVVDFNTSIRLDDIEEEIASLETDVKRLQLRNSEPDDISINDFDLDGKVKFWSDFNKCYIHPKSIYLNKSFAYNEPFDVYSWGKPSSLFIDEYMDRIQFFAEECESMEGFQCFVDISDASGCAASEMLSEVIDEYSKKSVLLFANLKSISKSSARSTREADERNTINTSLALTRLKELSNLIIPLSIDQIIENNHMSYISANPNDHYQTSSILGMAIENFTLPYRLKNRNQTLSKFIRHLSPVPRYNISSLSTSIPLPISNKVSLPKMFKNPANQLYKASFMQPLSPITIEDRVTPYAESVMLRGVPEWALSSSDIEDFGGMDLLFSNLFQYQAPKRYYRYHESPAVIPVPFPKVFKNLTSEGIISEDSQSSFIKTIPILTHAQTSCQLNPYFDSLARKLDSINIREHNFYEIDNEEFMSCKEMILDLAEDDGL